MAKRKTAFGPPRRKRGQKGMFLGGLFGAGSASGPASGTSTQANTSTQIDPGGQYYPLEQGVLGVGQNLLNKQYEGYDPNQRFAEFTPDQLAAQQGVRNAQGAWQGNFNAGQAGLNLGQAEAAKVGGAGQTAFGTAAGGPGGLGAANPYLQQASGSWTDPGTADKWMNPYTKNVADATVAQAQRAWSGPGGIQQGLTDTFTGGGGGQFGRERMGDVAGKLTTDWSRGLSEQLGKINQEGYGQGMTAFGNEQQRQAQLGQTAGQLGVSDVTSQTALGTAQTNAQAQAAQSNIAAGQAQTKQGQDLSSAMYKDASALGTSGATQQQLEQQKKDFAYQQNREAFNWDVTRAQQAQGLAQGWQLPTSSSSQTFSNQTTTTPTGSTAGNIVGAASAIGGMSTGKDTTVAGDVGTWLGKQFARGGPIRAATGGHLAFGPGGQVPVTKAVRQRAISRQPAIQARLQAMGGPGITPGQTPGMMPPRPAFASGGRVYPVQSRRKDYELYHPSQWSELWAGGIDGGWARGGRVGRRHAFAEGGHNSDNTSADLSDWQEKRRLLAEYNRRQRMMESTVRNNEYQQAAEADLGGYWADAARQGGRGLATLAQIAGIPGSVNETLWGSTNLPTWGGMGRTFDRWAGEGTTPASSGFRRAGETATSGFGVGVPNRVLQAARATDRMRRAGSNVGDALNVYTAFPE